MLNETLHTKKINKFANEIIRNDKIKIVTIAGHHHQERQLFLKN